MDNEQNSLITPELEAEANEATVAEATQAAPAQTEQEPEVPVPAEDLPEKFRGKTPAEIAKSAIEAERRMHEIASERSVAQRQLELMQQQMHELQSQMRPAQTESDPLEELEKTWDDDPKEAVKRTTQRLLRQQQEAAESLLMQQRAREAQDFYFKQKAENPDYGEREQIMTDLTRKYGHILNPKYAQSKEVMEILDLASKGARVDVYERRAEERARKLNQSIKEEKRQAQSERSTPAQPDSFSDVDFDSLSLKEKEAYLAKLERQLGRAS